MAEYLHLQASATPKQYSHGKDVMLYDSIHASVQAKAMLSVEDQSIWASEPVPLWPSWRSVATALLDVTSILAAQTSLTRPANVHRE